MASHKNVLIVLAAGLGKRMGRDVPKMLIPVRGKPLLYWTLKNLESASAVDSVLLTAPKGYASVYQKKIALWKFRKIKAVLEGGKERQDSTRKALELLPEACEIVGIHDGARPLAAPRLIRACFETARKSGAAILAVPSKDTIKFVPGGRVIRKTIPRRQCWSAQTPQVFRKKIAERIHGLGTPSRRLKGIFTDDASMAEALGLKVAIVPSSYENIKVTTPEDLLIMESMLKRKKW